MLALRNLLRRPIRTSLTVFGIAVGVSVVVALVAVAQGMRSQVDDLFAAGDAHLILTRKDVSDPVLSYLPQELCDRAAALPEVKAAYPLLLAAKQLPTQPFFIYYGVPDGSPFLEHTRLLDGASLYDYAGDGRPAMLGAKGARNLGLEVGGTLQLADDAFVVVGIFETPTPLLDASAILRFEDAEQVSGLDGQMSSALIHLEAFDEDALVAGELAIEAAFDEVEATPPGSFTAAFQQFELADQTTTVFSTLAIIVGGFAVMNTMMMSVFERTREIGVLRAVGWSRPMILRQVLGEALLISLLGGPVGILLGSLVIEGIGAFPQFGWVAADYGAGVFARAMVVGVGMGVFGAAYPAYRAVQITPIEALRYE